MKTCKPLPLRVVLVIPFLILFTVAALFINWIASSNARHAAERSGYALAREIGNRIENHIHSLLDILPVIVEENRDAWIHGGLATDRPETMAPHLLDQMRLMPHLTFISFGFCDGRYVAASRDPEGNDSPGLAANFLEGAAPIGRVHPTSGRALWGRISEPFAYDPRTRPFMLDAERTGEPTWSDIEPYAGYRSLGVGLSAPVYDNAGRFLGVAAVSMALERVDHFMQDLVMGEAGVGFLAESDGMLIATSTPERLFRVDEKGFERLHLSAHPNPVLAAAARVLGTGSAARRMTLNVEGERYLYELRRIDNKYGATWVLGVVLPAREFMRSFERSNRQTLSLCTVTLLLMIVMGRFLSGKIAKPIERITKAARHQARGNGNLFPREATLIKEVNHLSGSLCTMGRELRMWIDELEDRVAERTADLETVNMKLLKLSMQDGLTGITNRRSFDVRLQEEWLRARRTGTPLTLVLCDIDYFKRVNDRHGHQLGDEVLKRVARCLEEGVRHPMDLAARYGGEEFALVFPETDATEGLAVVTRIRRHLAELAISDEAGGALAVTLSFGLATLFPGQAGHPSDLISLADDQLYAAKHAGRNCVRVAR